MRKGNIDALSKLVPWFFLFGHTHHVRRIPVLAGNSTVKKTTHALAIDQAHEQDNASVKGDRGAVGLTENSAVLRRWMVCGPEMARVIAEFQARAKTRMKKTELQHHEPTKHAQIAFA